MKHHDPHLSFIQQYIRLGRSFLPLIITTFFANAWDVFLIAFFFAQKTFIQGIKLTGSKE